MRDENGQMHAIYDFLIDSIWGPIVDYCVQRIPVIFVGII